MKRYVPPNLRSLSSSDKDGGLRSLEEREAAETVSSTKARSMVDAVSFPNDLNMLDEVSKGQITVQRGGCADPKFVEGSIMDKVNIPRGASKLRKGRSESHGSFGGDRKGATKEHSGVKWEVGAVSECGTREANEDSYIIVNNLLDAFVPSLDTTEALPKIKQGLQESTVGLFGLFDGHSGNQAARYVAEEICQRLKQELVVEINAEYSKLGPELLISVLRRTLKRLDKDFCNLCHKDGRDWESGTTALVAVIVDRWLVVANIGDCQGLLYRTIHDEVCVPDGWNELDMKDEISTDTSSYLPNTKGKRHAWREVATVHRPSNQNEKTRIEQANGWITTETDRPTGQQRHTDFLNEDLIGILTRSFGGRYVRSGPTARQVRAPTQRIVQVSRVCGELSVSRALGDRDFKAAFHFNSMESPSWRSPLSLSYPREHRRVFCGDLVANTPDFHQYRIAEEGCSDEFLLIGSDGLWDVIDMDDAARVVHDLLFRKRWTVKRTATRLAELAVQLGSSDNVTVIIVRIIYPFSM